MEMTSNDDHIFPVYLKYRNNKSFFRITSYETFEELKIIGKFFSFSTFTARIHPERVFISDMLENRDDRWETVSEKEFNENMEIARTNLIELPV